MTELASRPVTQAPVTTGAARGAPASIRLRLSAVFALFVLQLLALGAFGIYKLAEVNGVSAEIRQHWLQSIRLLGDLSNYMSDCRTAEGTHLLSRSALELAASEREATALNATVSRVQHDYEALPQSAAEAVTYQTFARQWAAYQDLAAQVLALSRNGQKSDAVLKYMTDSRGAFDAASNSLSRLTEQTVEGTNEATARAAQTYARARRLIFVAMAIATGLLILAIAFITHWLTNPLLDIARRMRALAAHDTDSDIPGTERDDEMGGISRSVTVFRDNAVALMSTQRRLVAQAAALEAALAHERRVTTEQRNFVLMTSHEFRTPLTIIDGHAQRLLKTCHHADAEDIEERATRIRQAVVRMTSIMDELLGDSRLLDGTGAFQRTRFDVAQLIREVCQMQRESAPQLRLEERLSDLPATMAGDPTLLFHALSNLVANALKYSPANAVVEVSAQGAAGEVVIAVHDSGMGIPAADRERIFERYFRGRNATGFAGTGVGLHLVAMVAAQHGGSVTVQSEEGSGSTFTLRLPVNPLAPAPAGPAADAARTGDGAL